MARSKDKHSNTTFPPGSTKLSFNPSPRLLRPSWAAQGLWAAHRGSSPPSLPSHAFPLLQHGLSPQAGVPTRRQPPAPVRCPPPHTCSAMEHLYLLGVSSAFSPASFPSSSSPICPAFSALSYVRCHRGTGAAVPLRNRLKLAGTGLAWHGAAPPLLTETPAADAWAQTARTHPCSTAVTSNIILRQAINRLSSYICQHHDIHQDSQDTPQNLYFLSKKPKHPTKNTDRSCIYLFLSTNN